MKATTDKQKSSWLPVCYHIAVGLGAILVLRLVATNETLIENYYASGLYPYTLRLRAAATGWLPFSLGDVIYASVIVLFITKIVKLAFRLYRKRARRYELLRAILIFLRWAVATYLLFLLLWGLNYYRPPVFRQLQGRAAAYSTEDLINLSADLAKALNGAGRNAGMYTFFLTSDRELCIDAVASFSTAASQLPSLSHLWPSLKRPLFPAITNALGVPGYYNPFTSEIQVNTNLPRFLLPYMLTHELAHQLGIAREEDADMAAYISCRSSANNGFRYSAYFHMFNEVNAALFLRDSAAAVNNYNSLDSLAKADERLYSKLLSADAGVAHASGNLYNLFLQLNHEPRGSGSYHSLVPLMFAYRKRYGEL